ncbi:MAG: tRNA (adenosine(37)-N6)-threonylcarbamoyltransferase complex transferase subunit TsaD [Candidatus Magasanikbacteria bacterium CG10_big_fil_rev_8_21_14_0_10_47_10]|uniref:tRNA N6-adenosine threonylcarbamoyltransferase n=1 Tax=Candidatus Magasanikbacteria bacterium CG10_big_fil_rev_8_21_14_0_10_47_10 TaxID=1974652 RepID=A0A2H0TRD7_9BACT|nr:MAG: tRNA (adenosine(37)-N6)-threonylcarbamoyltransferase complex transferase subunit TsaD [Candidatus Magasanikbacteria bacterium CG10_big_fil_rev_8_21_14_0_10_47_10]
MTILGIESSCDDTSVALLKADAGAFEILAEKTASQIDVHKKYGGVVPEIAGRKHAEAIVPLIEEVMDGQDRPDAIAVTSGPGLITGLLVGMEAAKNLSYLWDVPLIRVNHIEGHIYSVMLSGATIVFPAVCLIVSGGHTELILMKNHGQYELIGKTRDDAAGEAFDKVAKMLGMDYPGGPKISKRAETGNPAAIPFPRPMIQSHGFDFSFAGLKTAVLYRLRDQRDDTSDVCASFEQSIVDVLVAKTIVAAKKHSAQTVILAGGVSANKKLRETLVAQIQKEHPDSAVFSPMPAYSMDNGAMIALAGYYHALQKDFTPWQTLTPDPNWHVYNNK